MRSRDRRFPALLRRGGRSPVGGAPSYDPLTALPNLRLAVDAATVTLVGSDVDTWPDLSSVGQDLTVASAGVRPLWSATGFNGGSEPYVVSDGVTEWIRRPGFSWGSNPISTVSIIVVCSYVTLAAGLPICNYGGMNTRPIMRHQTLDRMDAVMSASSAITTAVNGWSTPSTAIARWNGTQAFLRVKGVDVAPVADAGAAHPDGSTFALFSTITGGSASNTRIAALYVCASVLTTDEITAFETYATDRWGV